MAHLEQRNFIKKIKTKFPDFFTTKIVLEIGSLYLNGTIRDFFNKCTYVGLDIIKGPCVDIICSGESYNAPDQSYDVVCSTECFEHTPKWVDIFQNMIRLCKTDGLVFFTCASEGRPEHGTHNNDPGASLLTLDYYKNLNEIDFTSKINFQDYFSEYHFEYDSNSFDLYFYGIRSSKNYTNFKTHMNWKDVPGFFDSDLAYKLAVNTFPEGSVFVEIGSWMGKSASCLGQLIKESQKSIKVYAVDTFEGSEEHTELIKDIEDHSSSLLKLFKTYTSLCGVSNIVTPIQGASLDVASKFKDESIDFIFIDASHDYENVLADIIAWYPKLKPGGLIAGDDYAPCWGGVIQAVNEYFKNKTVFFLNGNLEYTYSQKIWHWCHTKQSTGGKKMDVTLYAICKNEEKNVEKFIENSKKFSHTVVVDTGSTDNTVQLLKDAGITVHEHPQTRDEFDFSVARNQALSYVETDWAFSIDFNEDISELFVDGLEVIAEEFTAFKHERYDKTEGEEAKPGQNAHVRFHRTKNYTWANAIHETPMFIPTEKYLNEVSVETTIKITKEVESHNIDKQLFYLSICEREFKKDPSNTYFLWFIFKHYFEVKNFKKTIELGKEYLNISKPYFDPTRIDVFIMTSIAMINAQEIQKAANYAFHAVSEAMNIGGEVMGKAFIHLLEVGKLTQNPNIIVFASAFAQETLNLKERTDAIDKLFLTNLDDTPATAWIGHRQFAEWIVKYLNPEVIVDLGVDYGFSTFSFAIPRIGKVYGIDNFSGDDFVGQKEAYPFVSMKREKLHLQDNLEFINGDFNEVAKTWDKQIDILHIDGSHHYEDVKKDFETWTKFLNDDGVILLHDTCIENLNGNEYGVKKFFDEIDLPKCTFTHCYGLGVVSKNEKLIEMIKNTFNL